VTRSQLAKQKLQSGQAPDQPGNLTRFIAGTVPKLWGRKTKQAKRDTAQVEEISAEDPHRLIERFIDTHTIHYGYAIAELRQGRKRSHWSWYIFPTPPYIVNGVERGSFHNQKYALRTPEQTKAYLSLKTTKGINLRQNYLETMTVVTAQLEGGTSLKQLVGSVDAPKLVSSLRHFYDVASTIGDTQVKEVCRRAMSAANIEIPKAYPLTEQVEMAAHPSPKLVPQASKAHGPDCPATCDCFPEFSKVHDPIDAPFRELLQISNNASRGQTVSRHTELKEDPGSMYIRWSLHAKQEKRRKLNHSGRRKISFELYTYFPFTPPFVSYQCSSAFHCLADFALRN
jgi:uncharacterized protein (DUF1810 family)